MSSRQLRKLQQQRELEQAKLQAQLEEDESEDEPVVTTKPKASLFANLSAFEEDDNDDVDEEESVGKGQIEQGDLSDNDPAPTSATKKPKKSKKKKKKKATKGKDDTTDNTKPLDGVDEIDAALRELDVQQTVRGTSATIPSTQVDPEYQRVCALLGVNSQHLKVANEMRNLFGKAITDIHEDESRQVPRRQGDQVDLETALKGEHVWKKQKGLPEVTLRRNPFIQGKDDWPKSSLGGLTMEIVDDKASDGTIEFKYAYNQQYTQVQRVFRQAVEMGDPQNMIGLLRLNPYNISLLLVVSKIAKNQGDHALSADLLERALFTFGRAATTLFNTKISQGKARLDFARPENREVWLAGYHYIKALLMKGTYRTALEWAKLLLSLDPEGDPYCMRLLIHNFALKGHQFQYIQDVYSSKLPEIWSQSTTSQLNSLSHTRPSLAFAAMQAKESSKCRELLATAMQETPWLFNRLFQELNLDSPSSIWGIMPRTDAETLFTEIYVLQTKDLWNTPAATALLMEIAHTITKVDESSIPKLENSEMTLDVVRYVYVDDNPSIMKYAPSQLLHRSNNSDFDPLPPDLNIYSSYSIRTNEGDRADRGFGLGDDMNDPIAALARLAIQRVPGWMGESEDEETFNTDDNRQEEGEVGTGDNIPPSMARRILDMLWGGRQQVASEQADEWETPNDMPDHVNEEGSSTQESEDEVQGRRT